MVSVNVKHLVYLLTFYGFGPLISQFRQISSRSDLLKYSIFLPVAPTDVEFPASLRAEDPSLVQFNPFTAIMSLENDD